MARIKITRSSELNNLLRKVEVYVDGQKIGTISNWENKEFEIIPGKHHIEAKIDWCGSQPFPIEVNNDETKKIKINGYKYGNYMVLIFFGFVALHFLAKLFTDIDYIILFAFPFLLILFYNITFGSRNYLVISEN